MQDDNSEAACKRLADEASSSGTAHVWRAKGVRRTAKGKVDDGWHHAVAIEIEIEGQDPKVSVRPIPLGHGKGKTEEEAWEDLAHDLRASIDARRA